MADTLRIYQRRAPAPDAQQQIQALERALARSLEQTTVERKRADYFESALAAAYRRMAAGFPPRDVVE